MRQRSDTPNSGAKKFERLRRETAQPLVSLSNLSFTQRDKIPSIPPRR